MFDPIALGFYIVLLLPGFIFVQVYEHYLIREKTPQFEKAFEIILASAAIWTLAWAIPWFWPAGDSKREILAALASIKDTASHLPSTFYLASAKVLLVVCVWTFVAANIWGALRKKEYVNLFFRYLTGRDWYSSVAIKFLQENLNNAVTFTLEGKTYLGIMVGAPDSNEDKYLMLKDVYILHPDKKDNEEQFEKLQSTETILIKLDEIRAIQVIKDPHLKKKNIGILSVLKHAWAEKTKKPGKNNS